MELLGSWINVAGTNYNYKFNGIERVEAYNLDFATYRGMDPILGIWQQVDPKAEAVSNMSPYCSMGNNPIVYTDPEGDIIPLLLGAFAVGVVSNGIKNINNGENFWSNGFSAGLWSAGSALVSFGIGSAFGSVGSVANELYRAGTHALSQGTISHIQGGSFWQGAASGALSSGIGSAIGAAGGDLSKASQIRINNVSAAHILGGGIGGGIGSAIAGGSFWEGFGTGLTVGLFNHALHGLMQNDPYKPVPAEYKKEGGLPGFPEAEWQGTKNGRPWWKGPKGEIYEWDKQHGEIEVYSKRGVHQGSVNPTSGRTKPSVKGRTPDSQKNTFMQKASIVGEKLLNRLSTPLALLGWWAENFGNDYINGTIRL